MSVNEGDARQRLETVLERHVGRAVRDLFEALEIEVRPAGDTPDGEQVRSTYAFAGIIGLVGDLSGTLLLGGDGQLIGRTHPLRSNRAQLTTYEQLDWVGELANQLTGRLKRLLAGHGLSFEFSPPISLTGERLKHLPSKGLTHRAAFRAADVDVAVWIDASLSAAAAARPELFNDVEADDDGPEGTVTLF
jgi:CheY-specific phosphatase CheX